MLKKGNPYHRPSCGRKACPWVARKVDCKGACYREGVGYLARCNLCMKQQLEAGIGEEKVIHSVYQGESHRSLPFRLQRHYKDYRTQPRKRRKAGGGRGEDPGRITSLSPTGGKEMKNLMLSLSSS